MNGKTQASNKPFIHWNSDVKHVMRSEIATSVFSPHWGEERNLVRSVAALSPYRDALHEVFEYYCFLNNRRSLLEVVVLLRLKQILVQTPKLCLELVLR